jgi:DNA polymerase III subunit beta
VEAAGSEMVLSCDGSRFRLAMLPLEEYPDLPDMPAVAGTCDSATFARAVSRVAIAAGADATVPVRMGVNIEGTPDGLTLAATDSYRAAAATAPWTPASADGAEYRALVSAAALKDLAKSLDPGVVTLGLEEGLAGFSHGCRVLITRCIGFEFPQLARHFEREWVTTVSVDGRALATAVRRAVLVEARRTPVVKMDIDAAGVQVRAFSEGNDADVTVPGAEVRGEEVRTAFNPNYLTDALAAAGGTVTLQVEALSAHGSTCALITPGEDGDDYRHLLMAVRRDDFVPASS